MSREIRLLIWVTATVATGVLIHLLNDVLLPFVIGITIAYFFDPVADLSLIHI